MPTIQNNWQIFFLTLGLFYPGDSTISYEKLEKVKPVRIWHVDYIQLPKGFQVLEY